MPSRAASFSLDSLPALLATIFDQSQKSASTHRKNIALLFKLFTTCSAITEPLPGDRGLLLTGEKAFVTALKEGGINRILPVKKGQTNADRIVKLVCAFISHAGEQEAARQTADGEAEDATPISRLTSSLLKHLLKGFTAKDKNVRFRSTQFVATLMSGLGELDNTDYQALLSALLLRIRDKEGAIRVQAVLALSKLQNPDELVHLPEIGEDGVPTAEGDLSFDDLILVGADSDMENPTKVLIDVMRHDPSAEVRRAALFQLQLVPQTLPYVLSRARDADPINRRLLYASCLAELPNMGVLTPSQRVLIVKYGCADREESVKKAATALLGKWAALGSGREGGEQIDGQEAVHEFVSLFDVVGEVKTAELAIQAIFESRQDLALQLQFPDAYWHELTPESALIARLYIAHCKATNDEIRLEVSLPVITAFAFKIQAVHNTLLELHGQILASTEDDGLLQAEDRDALLRNSENVTFVIDQLLQVALLADYGDEIGRRKMFTLVRDMISDPNLPSSLISGCMDVLHKLSSHERDFQRVIVEIVQNVREDANAANETPDPEAMTEDDEEDDEAELLDLENATAEEIAADQRRRLEKAAKKMQNQTLDLEKKETYIRCLELVRALLERVDGVLSDNATLMGLVHDLIVPSVKSKEPEIRENGLLCLGLCCLLDKSYALDSFGLFVHQSQETNGELQIKIFKIIFDILMLYGVSFLTEKFEDHDAKRVLEFLLHALNQDSMEIQAVAAIGIAKLMLSGMVADNEVLKRLVLVYFAPETIDNLELRQCLSYFFPVYCYSQSANQKRMQEIFLSCLEILSVVHEDLDDPSMMVSPVQLANQLLDWTDPQKAVAPEGVKVDETIQVDLTIDILKQIYKEPKKETRKQLCQLLGKLHIPDSLDEWQCKNVLLLISQLDSHRPLKDTVSRNALTRFENGLKKRFPAPVPLNEDEFRELDQLLGVVTFLDAIRAENDERESGDEFEQPDAGAKKKPAAATRKRKISRSPSVASTAGSVAAAPRGRSVSATVEPDTSIIRRSARAPKPAAKKQPVIVEEDESESESSSESESASDAESESAEDDEAETSKESLPKKVAPPAKAKPKAKAASKAASRPVSKTASTSSTGSKASATQDASDDTDDTM